MVMLTRVFEGDDWYGLPTHWYGLQALDVFVGGGITLDLRDDYIPPDIASGYARSGTSFVINEHNLRVGNRAHQAWDVSQAETITRIAEENGGHVYLIVRDFIPVDRIPNGVALHYNNNVDDQNLIQSPTRAKNTTMFDITGKYDDRTLASAAQSGVRIEPRKKDADSMRTVLHGKIPNTERLFRVYPGKNWDGDAWFGIDASRYNQADLDVFSYTGVTYDWLSVENPRESLLHTFGSRGVNQVLYEDQVHAGLLRRIAEEPGELHVIHTKPKKIDQTAAVARAG
ncbi:hypothetical protein ACFLQN_04840, partial [Candidatus Aenigmatarchaeota archaeon]